MSDVKLPGFEVMEKLGQGGMASVWKARQVSLDRIVAIKILGSNMARSPEDVQRFQAEAQRAAKLKHPAIVQVYDAHAEAGLYYFVMEFVAGYTVGDWVRRKGVLPEKDVILVAECVADALDYAWQNAAMIHCDIKPDNIIVDADGTVKVADLGLSRTINSMANDPASEDVMGTPAYIAPEQAMGMPDLDCRADIYSLGAMMYHLATGKLLFEGHDDEKVMELQVTGKVDDPICLNPKISKNMCWLLEKMLAKKKEDRHKDWAAVKADLARVKKGLPILNPPHEAPSTISRSTKRTKVVHSTASATPEPVGMPMAVKISIAAAIVAVAGFAFWRFSGKEEAPARTPRVAAQNPIPVTTTTTLDPNREENARGTFEIAKQWSAQNPGRYEDSIQRFQKVVSDTRGTKYAMMAEEEIRRLANMMQEEAGKTMKQLGDQTADLIRDGKFIEAAAFYEGYSGPYAKETEKRRKDLAADLRTSKERMENSLREKQQQLESATSGVLDQVVTDLTTGTVEEAYKRLNESFRNETLAANADLQLLKKLLEDARNVDDKVMDTFRQAKGQEITVALNDGSKKITIMEVADGKVTGQQRLTAGAGSATVTVPFGISDLSPRERLQRMGTEEAQPEVALVKGIMALNSKAFSHARKSFGFTHRVISSRMVAAADSIERKQAGDGVKASLALIVKSMGVAYDPSNDQGCIEAIGQKKIGQDVAGRTLESVAAFRTRYGNTEEGKGSEPILSAIEQACHPPEPKIVLAAQKAPPLPPKLSELVGNTEGIIEFFLSRNPDVASRDIRYREDGAGKVVQVEVFSRGIVDLGPLAAFRDLKDLNCGASRDDEPAKLGDINALRGLQLENFSIGGTFVRDLSPLRGMPLRRLYIRSCPVSEIGALKDCPMLSDLSLRNTEVKDLAALKGLRLKRIELAGSRMLDLKALAGMPLEWVDVENTQVKDVSPLKDSPLKCLIANRTKIVSFLSLKDTPLVRLEVDEIKFRDMAMLKNMSIKELVLSNTGITDLSPLKGMSLNRLHIANLPAKDLSSIADMPIRDLNVRGCKIEDLDFLKDMPLEVLCIAETKIFDLSPLEGMRLRDLDLTGTRVRDIKVLAQMPLVRLECRNVPVASFEPLRRSPLKFVSVDKPESIHNILRTMPNLEKVNWSDWKE